MVLESIINPFRAEQNPHRMFPIGVLYYTVAMLLSLWIFEEYSSIITVFFVTMASLPLIFSTIKLEEKKDMSDISERALIKEHGKALSFFVFLFIGITLAAAFWYVVLPASTVSVLFQSQTSTLSSINSKVLGGSFMVDLGHFGKILFNNVKVLVFCVLFSFIYGAGAIFILAWNATVIGTAIGNFVRTELALYSGLVGLEKTRQYLQIVSVGLFKYAIHGIPEILAYFIAGLAGGIISVAVIRHDFGSRKFEHIVLDSAELLLISIVVLVLAAFLEVYVTPMVF